MVYLLAPIVIMLFLLTGTLLTFLFVKLTKVKGKESLYKVFGHYTRKSGVLAFGLRISSSILKYPQWVIAYLFGISIITAGINSILSGITDSETTTLAIWVAFMIVEFSRWRINKLIAEKKDLADVIRISSANDNNFLRKLKWSDPSHYCETRDIALSIIFDQQNLLKKYKIQKYVEKAEDIVSSLNINMNYSWYAGYDWQMKYWWSIIHEDLSLFEKIIMENISEKNKAKYEQNIYYFRLNALEGMLPEIIKLNNSKKEVVKEDKTIRTILINSYGDESTPELEFLKMVSNIFYNDNTHWKGRNIPIYQTQTHKYNEKEFVEFLKTSEYCAKRLNG